MYGKKRIVITERNQIVLAGGKSWIPIGRFQVVDGLLIGRLRLTDSWDTKLDEKNSTEFKFHTVGQLRTFVKEKYKERLEK